jgi:hypothetical protein
VPGNASSSSFGFRVIASINGSTAAASVPHPVVRRKPLVCPCDGGEHLPITSGARFEQVQDSLNRGRDLAIRFGGAANLVLSSRS